MQGYPYLDNNAEYNTIVPAAEAMTSVGQLVAIPSYGLDINGLGSGIFTFLFTLCPERMLKETKYYGFPVVDNKMDMRLMGFITRDDLRGAIGMVMHQMRTFHSPDQSINGVFGNVRAPCIFRGFAYAQDCNADDAVDFSPWMDSVQMVHCGRLLGLLGSPGRQPYPADEYRSRTL